MDKVHHILITWAFAYSIEVVKIVIYNIGVQVTINAVHPPIYDMIYNSTNIGNYCT